MEENRTLVEARCPWDGPVPVRIVEMSCAIPADGSADASPGLCSFTCPVCNREVINPIPLEGIKTLWLLGSKRSTGHVPFELLEPHAGPPLSWDDVLNAHEALKGTCCPAEPLASSLTRGCKAFASDVSMLSWCAARYPLGRATSRSLTLHRTLCHVQHHPGVGAPGIGFNHAGGRAMERHTNSKWKGPKRSPCRVCPDLYDPFAPEPEDRLASRGRNRRGRPRRMVIRHSSTRGA